jgi:hypothetical protein
MATITNNIIDNAQNGMTTAVVPGEQNKDYSATTTFTTDANIVTGEVKYAQDISSRLTAPSVYQQEQSIKDFLMKPLVIQSGTLTSADTFGSFASIQIPMQPLLTNSLFKNKLDGYLGFKGTMVLRLEINGNRFQAGRYMLCIVPTGGSSTNCTGTNEGFKSHTNTLVQRTQLQRIELDVNCDTEGIMTIPFNSVLNYWPISSIANATLFGNTHFVQLFPYSPMNTVGGSSTALYTIWMNFTDIQLIAAAGPQMGRVSGGITPTEKEQMSKNIGPIQSTLLKISKAATIVQDLPLLSSIASVTSWHADILASAASVFGWSKPINLDTTKKITREVLHNFGHVDACDNGEMVAASARNQVEVAPGFSGTDIDEMDFSFIATIPAYNTTFNWTTGNASGTQLYFAQVNPQINMQTRTSNTIAITDYSPLNFVSTYFEQWRGSIHYTFKFVKTEFHSGRIAICFFPYEDGSANILQNFTNTQYTYREVVDIRQSNEITIAVPYISSSPWKYVSGNNKATGGIVIYVIDPLVAPANVPTTIPVLVEIGGGPDIEFSVPLGLANVPVQNVVGQMGDINEPTNDDNVCSIVNTTIGNAVITHDKSRISSSICVGESITSFRTLLKMTNILAYTSQTAAGTSKYLTVVPFAASPYWSQATLVKPLIVPDLYSTLMTIFCYSRGGVRLKFLDNLSVNASLVVPPVTYIVPTGSTTYNDMVLNSTLDSGGQSDFTFRTCAPQVFHQLTQNLASECSVPQYLPFHSRVNSEHYMTVSYALNTANRSSLGTRYAVCHTTGVANSAYLTQVCRAGADDCNFGCFISIPPMTFLGSVAQN